MSNREISAKLIQKCVRGFLVRKRLMGNEKYLRFVYRKQLDFDRIVAGDRFGILENCEFSKERTENGVERVLTSSIYSLAYKTCVDIHEKYEEKKVSESKNVKIIEEILRKPCVDIAYYERFLAINKPHVDFESLFYQTAEIELIDHANLEEIGISNIGKQKSEKDLSENFQDEEKSDEKRIENKELENFQDLEKENIEKKGSDHEVDENEEENNTESNHVGSHIGEVSNEIHSDKEIFYYASEHNTSEEGNPREKIYESPNKDYEDNSSQRPDEKGKEKKFPAEKVIISDSKKIDLKLFKKNQKTLNADALEIYLLSKNAVKASKLKTIEKPIEKSLHKNIKSIKKPIKEVKKSPDLIRELSKKHFTPTKNAKVAEIHKFNAAKIDKTVKQGKINSINSVFQALVPKNLEQTMYPDKHATGSPKKFPPLNQKTENFPVSVALPNQNSPNSVGKSKTAQTPKQIKLKKVTPSGQKSSSIFSSTQKGSNWSSPTPQHKEGQTWSGSINVLKKDVQKSNFLIQIQSNLKVDENPYEIKWNQFIFKKYFNLNIKLDQKDSTLPKLKLVKNRRAKIKELLKS